MGVNYKFTTLIVDDDDNFATLLRIRLKAWQPNISIDHAGSLDEARDHLSRFDREYDLVILDHNLPDGHGSELFDYPPLANSTVLAVSADDAPELPGVAIKAGAQHFLGKRQVSEPLFIPLLEALIQRKQMEKELIQNRIEENKMRTIRILLATLRHEINNPLGAVLGGTYLLKCRGDLRNDQKEALRLIEESSHRIKHVIERLCDATELDELEEVVKGQEMVYHVPGDISWEEQSRMAEERARERARKRGDL